MKSVENCTNEIVINKSRFICELIYIENTIEIKDIINKIHKKYKGATHYCYAYIYDNIKRFTDDGEPSGTAGIPILNVLESNNLNHVLCIITRYFGGIKLGAGGLVRAYTKAVTSCLKKTKIIELKVYTIVKIEFTYDKIKKIDSVIDEKILKKEFNDTIIYEIALPKDNFKNFLNLVNKYIVNFEILNDSYLFHKKLF